VTYLQHPRPAQWQRPAELLSFMYMSLYGRPAPLSLLTLSMAGRTRNFSAYPNTGVVLVSIRFPGQVTSLRSCLIRALTGQDPPTS
jgi:hypothetical protein